MRKEVASVAYLMFVVLSMQVLASLPSARQLAKNLFGQTSPTHIVNQREGQLAQVPIWHVSSKNTSVSFALCITGEADVPIEVNDDELRAKIAKHNIHVATRQASKSFSFWAVDPIAATDLHTRHEPFLDDVQFAGTGARCVYGNQVQPDERFTNGEIHLAFRCDKPRNGDPSPELGCDFAFASVEHHESDGVASGALELAKGKLLVSLAPKDGPNANSLENAMINSVVEDLSSSEDQGQLKRHPEILRKALASGSTLRLETSAGMCNQLRTILSFAKWAKEHGKQLEVYWTRSPHCPTDVPGLLQQPDPSLWNVTLHDKKDLPKGAKIDVKTIYTVFDRGYDFFPEPFGLLRPVPRVVDFVRGTLQQMQKDGSERFLAIHVRRTDLPNKLYTKEDEYLKWIKRRDPDGQLKVHIATDNQETQKFLHDKLGARAFVLEDIKNKPSGRHTSIDHAIGDILVAAMSFDFMGTTGSSFSRMIMGLRQHRTSTMRMLGLEEWDTVVLDADSRFAR